LVVDRLAGQVHAGNIDFRLTEYLADKADDAGAVFVEQHQDIAVGESLHVAAVNTHNAIVPFTKHGSTDRMFTLCANDRQAYHAGESARCLTAGFRNTDAAFFYQVRCIDVVGFRADHWRQDALQGSHGQWLSRIVGNCASIFKTHLFKPLAIQLGLE